MIDVLHIVFVKVTHASFSTLFHQITIVFGFAFNQICLLSSMVFPFLYAIKPVYDLSLLKKECKKIQFHEKPALQNKLL